MFTLVTLVLYFSLVLNWTTFGDRLAERLESSHVTGPLLIFVATFSISYWASRRTHSSQNFYTAGGQTPGL